MLAIIRGTSSQIAIDINASVEWTLSDLRQHGEAKVTISRDSAAWAEEVISDEGGFFFEILTAFGTWRGIADIPKYTESGAEITIRNITHWLAIRRVGERKYYSLTPGAIVQEAIHQGLKTAVPITIGSILQAPPIIPEYVFQGQSVLDVLTDMSEASGQTWELNDLYQLSWIPRQGNHYETWLVDDGTLLSDIQLGTIGDQYAEIIETDDVGRRFTAFNYTHALWPQQKEANGN